MSKFDVLYLITGRLIIKRNYSQNDSKESQKLTTPSLAQGQMIFGLFIKEIK